MLEAKGLAQRGDKPGAKSPSFHPSLTLLNYNQL